MVEGLLSVWVRGAPQTLCARSGGEFECPQYAIVRRLSPLSRCRGPSWILRPSPSRISPLWRALCSFLSGDVGCGFSVVPSSLQNVYPCCRRSPRAAASAHRHNHPFRHSAPPDRLGRIGREVAQRQAGGRSRPGHHRRDEPQSATSVVTATTVDVVGLLVAHRQRPEFAQRRHMCPTAGDAEGALRDMAAPAPHVRQVRTIDLDLDVGVRIHPPLHLGLHPRRQPVEALEEGRRVEALLTQRLAQAIGVAGLVG